MFKPVFTITPEINTRIAQIEKLRTVVNQATLLPELEVQLRFRATVESVHSSTSIEGNPLNELQVQKVLQGKVVTAPDYTIIEVLNYKEALDWLHKQEKIGRELKTSDVLKLHSIVMKKLLPKEKVGRWRLGSVYVVDEVRGKEVVRYTGPAATAVPRLVESLIGWISAQVQSVLHPVLLAGLIHYLFVSIHPFSDGNGRTTRLLTSHYLKSWGYDFRGSLSLDTYYLQHRLEYYDALSRADNFDDRVHADLTPFLDFFTKGFLETVENIAQYVGVGKASKSGSKSVRLNQEALMILDYVHQFGSINVKEATTVLSATKRTVQRRLMELVEKKILSVEGKGPATKYVLVVA